MMQSSIRLTIVSKKFAVVAAGMLLLISDVEAQDAPAGRRFDEFGGLASTRIVVRLNADSFRLSTAARADAVADADLLPRLSRHFRTEAAGWHATGMRRLYLQPFARPALAEKYAFDRTFVLEVPRGTNTEALAAAIAALRDDVEFATPDVIGGVAADPLIPNDTQFGLQWGMNNTGQSIQGVAGIADSDIDAPEAWAIHTGDFGTVTVAVIDSGINSHPEFGNTVPPYPNGRIVQGYNTYLDSSLPADLQDGCPHGTHVAGIIAAQGNNSIGVAGVTWGAYIMPVRVLFNPPNGCDGVTTDLAEGIIWAADNGANVINMSLQFDLNPLTQQGLITTLQNAIDYAHDRGVLLVGAAGNNEHCGFGVVCYPAKAANVLGVAATDNRDNFASFSNFGPEIDVCAPGKNVWSTWTNGSYAYLFGTSMAAPHVSGLAALVKSYVPELTNDQIAAIILSTTKDLGPAGWDDHYGFGRVNAASALGAADYRTAFGACCDGFSCSHTTEENCTAGLWQGAFTTCPPIPGPCGCGGPETDADSDGVADCVDNCPNLANVEQVDTDGDGFGNACDNCVMVSNPFQEDGDADGVGNACDNCPTVVNAPQTDTEGDGVGDACDNCPLDFNPTQSDADADGNGNACDLCPRFDDGADSDGDGVPAGCDECPNDPTKSSAGQCGCGVPDVDTDGDTVSDCLDQCPDADDRIDSNTDTIPDCLEPTVIPTASTWGLVVLTLLLLTMAKLCFARYRANGAIDVS